jgi:hypothetical protein
MALWDEIIFNPLLFLDAENFVPFREPIETYTLGNETIERYKQTYRRVVRERANRLRWRIYSPFLMTDRKWKTYRTDPVWKLMADTSPFGMGVGPDPGLTEPARDMDVSLARCRWGANERNNLAAWRFYTLLKHILATDQHLAVERSSYERRSDPTTAGPRSADIVIWGPAADGLEVLSLFDVTTGRDIVERHRSHVALSGGPAPEDVTP